MSCDNHNQSQVGAICKLWKNYPTVISYNFTEYICTYYPELNCHIIVVEVSSILFISTNALAQEVNFVISSNTVKPYAVSSSVC